VQRNSWERRNEYIVDRGEKRKENMNPITAWIARNMESFEDSENSMGNRIAE
jgi:hypothetical protein